MDRRAGDYRVPAHLLVAWRRADTPDPGGRLFAGHAEVNRTDMSIVAAAVALRA